MTDLRESMSRLLEDEPAVPMITDHIVADARRTQRRRGYAAGAAVMGSVAVTIVCVAVATSGGHNGRGVAQIVTANSATPTPSSDPLPMAMSTVDTPSGSVRIEVPKCPAGQLPNLNVDHDQAVNPQAAVHALAPSAYIVVGYGQPSAHYQPAEHFLVDGGPPPADSSWVLAWNAAGPANLSILSTTTGSAAPGNPFGTSGFNATYIGCLADPH